MSKIDIELTSEDEVTEDEINDDEILDQRVCEPNSVNYIQLKMSEKLLRYNLTYIIRSFSLWLKKKDSPQNPND